ncbi:MAG: DNA polymerase IV, partial [Oscillospiraceae bacterium]|nr:DNA polymerase IV [Oscillospiraceae bacterium]
LAKSFNVKTAETIWQAKQKCPSLILVPPNFERYMYFSKKARSIYERYTDQIEPFGIDECWLDVTGSRRLFGDEIFIANTIKDEIKTELGLTISVGVSFNKIFAKIGSDLKKPDAVSVIPPESFKEIVWPLPISDMIGIGRATGKSLHELGIFTIGDLAETNVESLKFRLGKSGVALWHFANGLDNSVVAESDNTPIPKSIGRSVTCPRDLCVDSDVWPVLLRLSEDVTQSLRKNKLEAASIQISLRTCDLETSEFQAPLSHPTALTKLLSESGMKLFLKNYDWKKPLRLVGIRAINLQPACSQYQFCMFDNYRQEIKLEKIDNSIDALRQRFGANIICRASLLHNKTAGFELSKPAPDTLGCVSKLMSSKLY